MIKSNEIYFTVSLMCRVLSVSCSGYYSLRSRPFSDKDQANQILLIDIKRVLDEGMVELVTNTLQATSR